MTQAAGFDLDERVARSDLQLLSNGLFDIVFAEHPDLDCIVHFHCPLRSGARIAVREQRPYECGSHECGKNTSSGLAYVEPGIAAVMLDRHGPNVVFSSRVDAGRVIAFIDRAFDLERSTDGVLVAPATTVAAE